MSVAPTSDLHAGEALGIEVQPDDEYFDVMARVAETHWWYRARRDWVRQVLRGRLPTGERAIDVGCGTGEAMAVLDELGASVTVGTDLSSHVLRHVVRRPNPPRVLESQAERLPFPDASAGCVISLEVIEHLDDDLAALRECHRLLRPGGTLLVTVPAYQWLWSEHDDRAAHRRRYRAARFERAVRDAGFEVERVTYYFSFLVPPAALLRRTPLKRLVNATDEDVSTMHPLIDKGFAGLAKLERAIGRRWRIPFGLSILCVAHRPAVPAGDGARGGGR